MEYVFRKIQNLIKDNSKWNICDKKKDIFRIREDAKNQLLDFFYNTDKEIRLATGELSSLLDEDFSVKVENLFHENAKLKLEFIAGPNIFSKKNKKGELYHPFLEFASKFPDRIKVYKNKHTVDIQNYIGYFHFCVVDNGKMIHIEEPHDYSFKQKYSAYTLEEDKEIGEILINFFNNCKENIGELVRIEDFNFLPKDFFGTSPDLKRRNIG